MTVVADRDETHGGVPGFEVVREHVGGVPAQPGTPAGVQVVPGDREPFQALDPGIRAARPGHRDRQVHDGVAQLRGEARRVDADQQLDRVVGARLGELHPVEPVRHSLPGVPGPGVADVLAHQRPA